MLQFDLTTIPTGIDQLKTYVQQCVNQLGGVVAEAMQALTSPKSGMEAQTKAAKAIIAAGKKNNVAELEIVMAEEAGLSLGSMVNGVPIKAIAGKSNTLTIKVTYKQ